ncbi:tumor necrosis factor receptor superfamily member 14-like [Archocentrus centrarchus]|uniref:tumor necrosis factor receptor superfamily member 14-like n=1 Tax=Archocentrus centrarchus TaxID=63155 RepID=UPI0011EA0F88|nr:tumor necrosis factor receptor superfamily member 14-like [Archocentrus centrarchus]
MFIMPYKMTSGGNSLTAAVLLIIMMKVFSVLTLSCPSKKYQTGNICCPRCPPGSRVQTDCTEDVTTSCVPCQNGTYTDKPNGLKQCIHCTHCDPVSGLKLKRSCTVTSDAVCEPLEGFYCLDHTGVSCGAAHEHRHCQPGQYISKTGTAYTDTECSECGSGTFSDGTFKICLPHKLCESLNLRLITSGNATTDAQCEEQPDNVTESWIITGCLLLIVLIVILITFLYVTNKITCPKLGENTRILLTNMEMFTNNDESDRNRRTEQAIVDSSMKLYEV